MEKLVKMLRFLSERDQLEVQKAWVASYADNLGHASALLRAVSEGALVARERAKGLAGQKRKCQGAPDFMRSEFLLKGNIGKLCRSITKDYLAASRPWPLKATQVEEQSIDWLNAMLRAPDLYDVLMEARQYPELPAELIEEIKKAAPYREMGLRKAASYGQHIIRKSNRLLIEHFYPDVPRYALKVVTYRDRKAEAWLETRLAKHPDLTPLMAVKQYLGVVSNKRKDGGLYKVDMTPLLVKVAQRIRHKLYTRKKRAAKNAARPNSKAGSKLQEEKRPS
jgi:hypothetical protein